MGAKTKTREITIVDKEGTFSYFFKKFSGEKKDYDFEGIATLRKILSNEKARILHTIKTRKPGSIYELSKILGRDIKTVNEDIKLLSEFGFIELISEKKGGRERHKPVVVVDAININLRV